MAEYGKVALSQIEGLSKNAKKIPNFEKKTIEVAGNKHLENYTYTAFFSGIIFNGQEVHVGRVGMGHSSFDTALVIYIKNVDGTLSKKKINGIDYSR
jgi:hypothetical protein